MGAWIISLSKQLKKKKDSMSTNNKQRLFVVLVHSDVQKGCESRKQVKLLP